MSPSISPIDLKLDEWGSRLFNVSTETLPRPRRSTRSAFGAARPVRPGGRLSTSQARATYVRQKLQAMVRRSPQVVVKLVRAPKGMKGISNNLTYISRDGQLEIEDQDGQVILGKEAVADLKDEWRDGGLPILADSTMRDAFHLVLSMPTRTDPLSVQRAARDFATREFAGFQYAMVLHTFETDPDPNPSPHPHVHLTVKAAGLDGVRLNPRKADLQRWREGFAEALREHGIEATTTSRIHRTTHERWTVRHLHEPSKEKGETLERMKRTTRRHGRAQEIMRNYEQVMRALARSDRGEDRQLAADLVRYLSERSRDVTKTRSPERDRSS
ncbi:MAG: relaxase/mobilization nuclease domain-containing protein [Nitrospira sp.]|nr:relaxase/mobilization nuclease domain-containing protein [Nitrospira sp.]